MIVHKHPTPEQWANFLSIAGVDRGVFSTVKPEGEDFIVTFDNGVEVRVTSGPLQQQYQI